MCLIIASKTGVLPDEALLKQGLEDNNDAWGIAWVQDGSVQVVKGYKEVSMLKAAKRAEGFPYMLHYRWATHGDNSLDNGHPFKVAEGLWMMHNGVINIQRKREDRSDTYEFASLLSDLVRAEETWYGSEDFGNDVADFIGYSNKVVFLDATGEMTIVNEDMGSWLTPDIWLSNENSLRALKKAQEPARSTGAFPMHGSWSKDGDTDLIYAQYPGNRHGVTDTYDYKGYKRGDNMVNGWSFIKDGDEDLDAAHYKLDEPERCELCQTYTTDVYLTNSDFLVCSECYKAGESEETPLLYKANGDPLYDARFGSDSDAVAKVHPGGWNGLLV